jgi:hypothetical protein
MMLYNYEMARREANARHEEFLREAARDHRYTAWRKGQMTIESKTKMSLGARVAATWFSLWNRPQLRVR